MSPIILTLAALLQAGATASSAFDDYRAEQAAGPHAEWWAAGASALVETLRHHPRRVYLIDMGSRRGFVSEADLPRLISLLDSADACAVVLQPPSAHLPTRASTVGHEAALLVEGFRQGRYPIAPASDLRHVDLQALRGWWDAWQRAGKAREWPAGPGPLEADVAYVGDFRLGAGWEPLRALPLPLHHAGRIDFVNLDDFGALRFGLWRQARVTFRVVKAEVTAAPGGAAWRTVYSAEILRVE